MIINPVTHTNEGYISHPASDIAVIFANDSSQWPSYQPDVYVANYPAHRFAMLAVNVPDVATMKSHIDLAKQRNIGYVYLTDDTLPNSWDSLPTFWQEEVACLAVGSTPTRTPTATTTATNTAIPSTTPAKKTPIPTNTPIPSTTPTKNTPIPSTTPAKKTPIPTNTPSEGATPSPTPTVIPDNMLYLPVVIR